VVAARDAWLIGSMWLVVSADACEIKIIKITRSRRTPRSLTRHGCGLRPLMLMLLTCPLHAQCRRDVCAACRSTRLRPLCSS
jgi:hypothetical protein